MKIGIYFTPTKDQGGVYSYSVSVLDAFSDIKNNKYFILTTSPDVPQRFYGLKNFEIRELISPKIKNFIKIRDAISYIVTIVPPTLINILYKVGLFNLIAPILKVGQRKIIDIFEKQKLDLIFYVASSNLSFLINIPSVTPIHDIQHRINPHFKEVSSGGRWEYREYEFSNIAKKSFRVLVDSEIGKEDMINYYHTNPDKIVILPYLAPSYLNSEISLSKSASVIKRFHLPRDFIFYPAKFWPHKNHINLVKAIKILNKQGKRVNLVLAGSKNAEFSTYEKILNFAKKYKLDKQIFYVGYVDNNQLSALYKKAIALVMPTYFGPTNIPILEAWTMGTPVITSDIRGCREQLGDAGLLVNPDDPSDIATKIWKIYNNKMLAVILSKKGKFRLNNWTYKDFARGIEKIIQDFEKEKDDKKNSN